MKRTLKRLIVARLKEACPRVYHQRASWEIDTQKETPYITYKLPIVVDQDQSVSIGQMEIHVIDRSYQTDKIDSVSAAAKLLFDRYTWMVDGLRASFYFRQDVDVDEKEPYKHLYLVFDVRVTERS